MHKEMTWDTLLVVAKVTRLQELSAGDSIKLGTLGGGGWPRVRT